MIYYFVLVSMIIFSTLSVYSKDKVSSHYIGISILILVLFSGLRVDAGYDYYSYLTIIESGYYQILFEPIPLVYSYLADYLGTSQVFFCLSSITLGVSLFYFLKNERSRNVFLALYFSMPFCYIDSFSMVRQYISVSYLMMAYAFFKEHRIISLIFIILATLSHNTAIFAVMVFSISLLIYKSLEKIHISVIIFLFCVIAIIVYVNISVNGLMIDRNINTTSIGIKGAVLWFILSLPFIYMVKKYLFVYSDSILVFALIGLAIYIFLAPYGYFVSRFYIYFAPFALLFISRSMCINFGKKAIIIASGIAVINTFMMLSGASKNEDFDFLNNYKLYPSSSINIINRSQ